MGVRVEIDEEKIYEGSIKEDWEWEAPMKDNPEYKGEWTGKRISNPTWKGIWEAKKIANPEYEDDDKIYSYADFGFLGFDLWQVKGGTIFDNVIVCDDVAEADAFAQKWKATNEIETAKKKEEDDSKKTSEAKADAEDDDDDDDEEKKEAEEM